MADGESCTDYPRCEAIQDEIRRDSSRLGQAGPVMQ